MAKPQSSINSPRRELISSVQKGVFALLILLVVGAVGLYKFIDLEFGERANNQSTLMTLTAHTHTAERYWFEWLLHDKNDATLSSEALSSKLTALYTKIDHQLSLYQRINPKSRFLDVKAELSFLSEVRSHVAERKQLSSPSLSPPEIKKIYTFIEKTKAQSQELKEQELLLNYRNKTIFDYGEWGPFAVFGLIGLVLFVLSVKLVKQLNKGFQHLHVVLEQHKKGHFTLDRDYHVIDEFTDIGRLFDNELSSREFELSDALGNITLMTLGLSKLGSAFLITNNSGDVKWLSKGFSDLWEKNATLFEPLFEIDPGLDGPLGEQLPERILSGDHDIKLSLSDGRYSLIVETLVEESSKKTSFLLWLAPLSQAAEIEVLRKSLELMVQGSWQYPIRVLRDDSPFKNFALLLEEIRIGVQGIISVTSALTLESQPDVRVTKLQQIKTLLALKINDNQDSVKSIIPLNTSLPKVAIDELNDMSSLSRQTHDSLLVGYELLLQQLALVEKDAVGLVQLLDAVDRCLNEVRSGVLSSLSTAKGDSDTARHTFSVDLDHDIDSVQRQIVSMQDMISSTLMLLKSDRSVGVARLNRAKQSVAEISDLMADILKQVTLLSDDRDVVGNSVAAIKNREELDSF
ncbi:hypothetical protein V6259_14220 [Marinomonas sp. TI.3.20]|uniref:hypothetical protein n=1 Tax=Marinomonas sp. TI.3.20 TaxID=3121296 RepID=UPI00311DECAB